MRLHASALFAIILICGCCSGEVEHYEPPPPPRDPSAIAAQTKALGLIELVPTIKMNDQVDVTVRLTWASRPLDEIPEVYELELLDYRGKAMPALTPTDLEGGVRSVASHATLKRSFQRPAHRNDIKQVRLQLDETQLLWDVDAKLLGTFELRPAASP